MIWIAHVDGIAMFEDTRTPLSSPVPTPNFHRPGSPVSPRAPGSDTIIEANLAWSNTSKHSSKCDVAIHFSCILVTSMAQHEVETGHMMLASMRARRPQRPLVVRVLRFFGFGTDNKARKSLVSLCWTLSIDGAQVCSALFRYF